MGVSKESISKFLIGNRFHVKLRILSPYSNRKSDSRESEVKSDSGALATLQNVGKLGKQGAAI